MNERECRETIICRCEDVTCEDISAAVHEGCTCIEELKALTRCGMGPCQGRTCGHLVARQLAEMTGTSVGGHVPSARPPTKPVDVSAILAGGDHAQDR